MELREFLHSVTSISATCICKLKHLNVRRGLKCVAAGKQYFPRWEKSCGTKQKRVHHESAAAAAGKRFLPCPEPQRVELFLKETTQFEGCPRDGDLVCSQC